MKLLKDKTYFPSVWVKALADILGYGNLVSPRGMDTIEFLQYTHVINMRKPVINIPERKLSYRFMAAEAYWILSGDNRVETIAPYNKRISEFSDNGETFYGAYGPMILGQLDHIVNCLLNDKDSRQAGLTIWRPNPPKTKDVPCTVAMFFNIRKGKLNCSTFMRSSDLWLGLPYDVFNFSMLSHLICCRLNRRLKENSQVKPEHLYLTAFSNHIYDQNLESCQKIIENYKRGEVCKKQKSVPSKFYLNEEFLMNTLRNLRDSKPGDAKRWWEK